MELSLRKFFAICELAAYEESAATRAQYCNQACEVQEQLSVSVKKDSTARKRQGLIDCAFGTSSKLVILSNYIIDKTISIKYY